jgi:hypothetical protein
VFSSFHFHYTQLQVPYSFHLGTSDGKNIHYQAIEHEKREYLSSIAGNCRAHETIKYTPGRKGIGARMEELRLEDVLQFKVTYLLPTEKEERTWHRNPEKIHYTADRVAKIEAPLGQNGEVVPIAQFTYTADMTEVLDVDSIRCIRKTHSKEGAS